MPSGAVPEAVYMLAAVVITINNDQEGLVLVRAATEAAKMGQLAAKQVFKRAVIQRVLMGIAGGSPGPTEEGDAR